MAGFEELAKYEQHKTVQGEVVNDEFEETSDDSNDVTPQLQEASKILKSTAHLLYYLADPLLVRAVSKRERVIIEKQLERVSKIIEEIDECLDSEE